MPTTAVTTAPIGPACPECGIIKKSGKSSCCGRGGSWFGTCGIASNTDLGHTWYEGIEACRARQFGVLVKQLEASLPKAKDHSDDTNMGMESKAIVVTAHMFTTIPTNMSTLLSDTTTITVPANESIIMPAHKLPGAHDLSKATSKPITAAIATIIHTSASMLAPNPTMPPVNPTIELPVNWIINSTDQTRMIESIGSSRVGMSTATSPHTSASNSFSAREFEIILPVVTSMSMTLIFRHLY